MKYLSFVLLLSCILINLTGCSQPPPPIPLSQAHDDIINKISTDLNAEAFIYDLGNTVWIYLPFEEPILQIKAASTGPMSSTNFNDSIGIRFLESLFEAEDLNIQYDIGRDRRYPVSHGYTSTYADRISVLQRGMLSLLHNTYGDVEPRLTEGEREKLQQDPETAALLQQKRPEFFVCVFADIRNGLEMEMMIYFEDLIRAFTGELSAEEYQLRLVSDIRGSTNIINSQQGSHLNLRDITMPEFLAAQIENRINFKFTQSAFPPSDQYEKEILTAVGQAFTYYNFSEYEQINIINLDDDSTNTISKEAFQIDLEDGKYEEDRGRIIEINFDLFNQATQQNKEQQPEETDERLIRE